MTTIHRKRYRFSIDVEPDVFREINMLQIPGCKSRAEKIRTLIDWALEEYKADAAKE